MPSIPELPVGDETEALRALAKTVRERLQKGERDDELMAGRDYSFTPWRRAYMALDAIVARVAGLEAREAALREVVDAARSVLDYEHTPRRAALSALRSALDALADSGEAGS